jgi:hypothetical protein
MSGRFKYADPLAAVALVLAAVAFAAGLLASGGMGSSFAVRA